ncbi:MAG: sigma-70 family RNA polymerase sigma factor [Planctomycetota bacterium]
MTDAFRTTRWSIVLGAGRASGTALTDLCEAYWYPLYAYARRRGHSAETAEDLTQGFFAELLEKNWVVAADREKGRFRAFLLTAFKRHIGHEREKARAKKRGGDRARLSLDFEDGERRYSFEPTHEATPERIFERRWALTLLGRVLDGLAAETDADLFAALRPHLTGEPAEETYREIALRLGMSEGGVKTAAHRLRARYRERLRGEIADTVSDPADVEDEIRALMEALRA